MRDRETINAVATTVGAALGLLISLFAFESATEPVAFVAGFCMMLICGGLSYIIATTSQT